jgi:hypothetical protein
MEECIKNVFGEINILSRQERQHTQEWEVRVKHLITPIMTAKHVKAMQE